MQRFWELTLFAYKHPNFPGLVRLAREHEDNFHQLSLRSDRVTVVYDRDNAQAAASVAALKEYCNGK